MAPETSSSGPKGQSPLRALCTLCVLGSGVPAPQRGPPGWEAAGCQQRAASSPACSLDGDQRSAEARRAGGALEPSQEAGCARCGWGGRRGKRKRKAIR